MKNFNLSLGTRREFIDKIDKLLASNPAQKLFVHITKAKKKRGLPANAQQHLWYAQIDKALFLPAGDTKKYCKVVFGVPILLMSDSEEARAVIRTLERCDFWNSPWLVQLDIISSVMVTSLFTKDESKQYMDNMIFHYNENGIPINYKDQ